MFRVAALALAFILLSPGAAGTSSIPWVLPFEQALNVEVVLVEPTPTVVWADPQVASPASNLPIEEWYDCRPPFADSICVDGFDHAEIVASVLRSDPDSPRDWRPIVELYFQPRHVNRALRVMRCESGGDATAKNPTSTASGLFQHLASLWPERSVRAGWQGSDVFDPEANIAVAAWLVYEGGGWGHWDPSRHCWG